MKTGVDEMAPPPLSPDEPLGRAVYSKRLRKRALKGKIDDDIYLEREEAESISVDRMRCASREELADLARKRGRKRPKPPNRFQGWAVLAVRDAAQNGRTVAATPTPENRCHADICLNIAEADRKHMWNQHAVELAALAHWEDPP